MFYNLYYAPNISNNNNLRFNEKLYYILCIFRTIHIMIMCGDGGWRWTAMVVLSDSIDGPTHCAAYLAVFQHFTQLPE